MHVYCVSYHHAYCNDRPYEHTYWYMWSLILYHKQAYALIQCKQDCECSVIIMYKQNWYNMCVDVCLTMMPAYRILLCPCTPVRSFWLMNRGCCMTSICVQYYFSDTWLTEFSDRYSDPSAVWRTVCVLLATSREATRKVSLQRPWHVEIKNNSMLKPLARWFQRCQKYVLNRPQQYERRDQKPRRWVLLLSWAHAWMHDARSPNKTPKPYP